MFLRLLSQASVDADMMGIASLTKRMYIGDGVMMENRPCNARDDESDEER